MASIGVALPLTFDSGTGYTMLTSLKSTIKQNFKMLLLTAPGERVMDPNFGVGLKTYLFANFHEDIYSEIDTKIREQVAIYIPIIKIIAVQFATTHIDNNKLSIFVEYSIPNIGVKDLLEFTI